MRWPCPHVCVWQRRLRWRIQSVGAWAAAADRLVPVAISHLRPVLAALPTTHWLASLRHAACLWMGRMECLWPVVGAAWMVRREPLHLPRFGFSDGIARWLGDIFFRNGGGVARHRAMVGGCESLAANRRAVDGATS